MGKVVNDRWGRPLGSTEKRLGAWAEAETDLVVVFSTLWPSEEEYDRGDAPVDVVSFGREGLMTDGSRHAWFVDGTSLVGSGKDAWEALAKHAAAGWAAYKVRAGVVEAPSGIDPDYAESAE